MQVSRRLHLLLSSELMYDVRPTKRMHPGRRGLVAVKLRANEWLDIRFALGCVRTGGGSGVTPVLRCWAHAYCDNVLLTLPLQPLPADEVRHSLLIPLAGCHTLAPVHMVIIDVPVSRI